MADPELTNYKCGIDVWFGTGDGSDKGTAYMEEYLYHDKLLCDRKVVYIKSDTLIWMQTNDQNQIANIGSGNQGQYYNIIGTGGISGMAGVIRYKVDRDMQPTYYQWSSGVDTVNYPVLPNFTGAFNFDSLYYQTGVPVVGTTGSNGALFSAGTGYYWRGTVDPFGDEWHGIEVAHDDSLLVPTIKTEFWSSDGKPFLFVVNPKTPCLTVRAVSGGEFYTTRPKAYGIPWIYGQTTYVTPNTGQVTFELKDLYQKTVVYRVNSGTWLSGSNPTFNDSIFISGNNTLEYYSTGNESFVKLRNVVKNPYYPSSSEPHGNLLWGGATGLFPFFSGRSMKQPYLVGINNILTNNDANLQGYWDQYGISKYRWPWWQTTPFLFYLGPTVPGAALENTYIAMLSGWNYIRPPRTKSFGQYGKEMLMGCTWSRVEPVGFCTNQSSGPHGSTEVIGAGYYFISTIYNCAFAYDLIVANFKSNQVTGGLTPVEDYYIRDVLAQAPLQAMQWMGAYVPYDPGMWGTARMVGGVVAMLAMPNYESPVFGRAGFGDNTDYGPTGVPFFNYGYSWKKVFVDRNIPYSSYPNPTYPFNPEASDLWFTDGNWSGPISYYPLMTQTFSTIMNMAKMYFPTVPYNVLSLGAYRAATSNLRSTNPTTPVYQSQPLVGSSIFGVLGNVTVQGIKNRNAESTTINGERVFGQIWYDSSLPSSTAPSPIPYGNASERPLLSKTF